MAHCIPTYILASGLIKMGMSWWQALVHHPVGNSDRARAHPAQLAPGHQVRHPLPRLRARRYGVFGANVPAVMRAIVACGWFGIQCWIGGKALQRSARGLSSGWPEALGTGTPGGHLPTEWLSYAIFWGINILIVYRGMDLLRRVENWAAPYVLVMTTLLLVWILRPREREGAGLGGIVSQPGKFPTLGVVPGRSSCRA